MRLMSASDPLSTTSSLPPGYLYWNSRPQQPIELTELFVLGQSNDSNLNLPGENIGERHCRIEFKGPAVTIRDLRSGFATFVNGTSIAEAFLLEGDEIQVGDHSLKFSTQKKEGPADFGLKSKNPPWNYQLSLLQNVAQTNFPVLLLGPSGTGKEVIAEAIHQHSKKAAGPMVKVNCSALSETLVESELFGHVKGSFTGAISDRKGAFEAARGGTLFLDEIGDLPLTMQAKLLRALENNEIRPVGMDRTIHTDVRVVAATHQLLKEKIQSGEFRADLYFRLNVVSVNMPKLSDRMEDFEDLMYAFAKKMRVRFSFGAIQLLKKHPWPGNIRELKNTVARASAHFPNQQIGESEVLKIIDDALSPGEKVHKLQVGGLPVIKELERQMIIKHLMDNNGNQRKTAIQLGMPKSTLYDRIRTYQIDPRQFAKPLRLYS